VRWKWLEREGLRRTQGYKKSLNRQKAEAFRSTIFFENGQGIQLLLVVFSFRKFRFGKFLVELVNPAGSINELHFTREEWVRS
jgi:hypothetical protein